jgi:hypothetical protein
VTSAALAEEVRRVRDAGVDTADIAVATGASTAAVISWISARRNPSGERRRRVLELSALVERLERVMTPDHVAIWLAKPLAPLDDERPIDRIAAGDYRSVSRLVAELENDSFS